MGIATASLSLTNYCESLDQVHKPFTCKLWDHLDGERRMTAPSWEPTAQ